MRQGSSGGEGVRQGSQVRQETDRVRHTPPTGGREPARPGVRQRSDRGQTAIRGQTKVIQRSDRYQRQGTGSPPDLVTKVKQESDMGQARVRRDQELKSHTTHKDHKERYRR